MHLTISDILKATSKYQACKGFIFHCLLLWSVGKYQLFDGPPFISFSYHNYDIWWSIQIIKCHSSLTIPSLYKLFLLWYGGIVRVKAISHHIFHNLKTFLYGEAHRIYQYLRWIIEVFNLILNAGSLSSEHFLLWACLIEEGS